MPPILTQSYKCKFPHLFGGSKMRTRALFEENEVLTEPPHQLGKKDEEWGDEIYVVGGFEERVPRTPFEQQMDDMVKRSQDIESASLDCLRDAARTVEEVFGRLSDGPLAAGRTEVEGALVRLLLRGSVICLFGRYALAPKGYRRTMQDGTLCGLTEYPFYGGLSPCGCDSVITHDCTVYLLRTLRLALGQTSTLSEAKYVEDGFIRSHLIAPMHRHDVDRIINKNRIELQRKRGRERQSA